MKGSLRIFFTIFSIFFILISISGNEENSTSNSKYSTKYDNVDLEEILHSDRLLYKYVKCLMEEERCTPDGAELKKNLPDALQNDCNKCSEVQKVGSKTVISYLIDNKPEWWERLEKKYNPDGSYRKSYLEEKTKMNSTEGNQNSTTN